MRRHVIVQFKEAQHRPAKGTQRALPEGVDRYPRRPTKRAGSRLMQSGYLLNEPSQPPRLQRWTLVRLAQVELSFLFVLRSSDWRVTRNRRGGNKHSIDNEYEYLVSSHKYMRNFNTHHHVPRAFRRPDRSICATPKQLEWNMETRETATLDAFRRSRVDAAAAADADAEILRSVSFHLHDMNDRLNTTLRT